MIFCLSGKINGAQTHIQIQQILPNQITLLHLIEAT